MKHILSAFAALFFSISGFAQISVSSNVANFYTVWSQEADSFKITLENFSWQPFQVTDINLFHDVYSVSDTAFTISPWHKKDIWIRVNALHNLNYMDYALIESPTHGGNFWVQVFSSVKYRDAYYNSTQNKSHEDLKSALKILLATNYISYSYNAARDIMFLDVDNKKVNGQGASTNTLECVYTGRVISGFVDRSDAQTNGNFNTEHTIPQSLFNENLPMRTDLHHLFPVDESVNNERGNKPFGIVNNPSYTNGGSKSNSSTFEPRDADKGIAARAVLYFAVRYQDYGGFIAGIANTMRQWHFAFPPTPIDTMRNHLVYENQNNRNPFVDHPELAETGRLASFTSTNIGPTAPQLHALKTLTFGSVATGNTLDRLMLISNQGPINDLQITNLAFSNPAFSIVGTPNYTIAPDGLLKLTVQFAPTADNTDYTSTLTLSTTDPNHPTWTVNLVATTVPVGLEEDLPDFIKVYPIPSRDYLWLEKPDQSPVGLVMLNGEGKKVREMNWVNSKEKVELRGLASGVYYLQLSGNKFSGTRKIVVQGE
ncbi:MAG: endonuclease [Bacteroidia bacterium]|nr:endonuclease [Bacteroidia bacterium]